VPCGFVLFRFVLFRVRIASSSAGACVRIFGADRAVLPILQDGRFGRRTATARLGATVAGISWDTGRPGARR
jgi:hypothetical protein